MSLQSGIGASPELHAAFSTLLSSPDQRALLAVISNETLAPSPDGPLRLTPDLTADLNTLQSRLNHHHAAYILLKTHPDAAERDGYVAITYVPSGARVRDKMLFAATRVTLVRELGIERFRRTVAVQDADDLNVGFLLEEDGGKGGEEVLTAEESGLREVKDAEAKESMGTGARRGHVSARVEVATGEGVVEALKGLGVGGLVMLKYDIPNSEALELAGTKEGVSADNVAGEISAEEPRYSFWGVEGGVVFIYTCPTKSRIKERMLYSTGKGWTRVVAERDAALTVTRSLEATEPSELTVEALTGGEEKAGQAEDASGGGAGTGGTSGFARPKRPGRR